MSTLGQLVLATPAAAGATALLYFGVQYLLDRRAD